MVVAAGVAVVVVVVAAGVAVVAVVVAAGVAVFVVVVGATGVVVVGTVVVTVGADKGQAGALALLILLASKEEIITRKKRNWEIFIIGFCNGYPLHSKGAIYTLENLFVLFFLVLVFTKFFV